jgi:WD40 repeat protein
VVQWVRDRQEARLNAQQSAAARWLARLSERRSRSARAAPNREFDAFISYSRKVDAQLARRVQTALQGFAKPWYRRRVLRVFRDDASLSANPGLWPSIQDALATSRFFLLFASPAAAQSEWVTRELVFWLERNDPRRLLIVLTEGVIAWNGERSDFDWSRTTALPPVLAGALSEEPRYVDLSWARTDEARSVRDPRLREAVADLAAPLRGVPKDELIGEDVRQHRRSVRLAGGAAAGLVLLALVSASLGVVSARQRNEARAQRDVATSRLLAQESERAVAVNRLDVALLLAAEAHRTAPTMEARDALRGAVRASDHLVTVVHGPPATAAALSHDGGTLAVGDATGRLQLWDTRWRLRLGEPRRAQQRAVTGLAFSGDGSLIAAGAPNGDVTVHDVQRHQRLVLLRPEIRDPSSFDDRIGVPSFAEDARTLAWPAPEGQLAFWDGEAASPSIFDTAIVAERRQPWTVAVSPDGSRVAAAGASSGELVLFRVSDEFPEGDAVVRTAPSGISSLAFGPANTHLLVTGGVNGSVAFWDAGSLKPRWQPLTSELGTITHLAFNATGTRIVAVGTSGVGLIDAARRRAPRVAFPLFNTDLGGGFTSAATVATIGRGGSISFWDTTGRPLRFATTIRAPGTETIAFDPVMHRLATAGDTVRFWDVGTRKRVGPTLGKRDTDDFESIVYRRDGARVATATDEGTIDVWDPHTGDRLEPTFRDADAVDGLAFRPSGELLAALESTSNDGTELWSVSRRKRLGSLRFRGNQGIWTAVFNPADETFATIDFGNTLVFWSEKTLRPIASFVRGVSTVAYTPDGRHLAVSGTSGIVLRDARTGEQVGAPFIDTAGDFWASIVFTQDGRTMAAAGLDSGAVATWEVRTRRRASPNLADSGHGSPTESPLAFSSDGRILAAGGYETTTVWGVDDTRWPAVVCRVAGRGLTREEWQQFVATRYREMCP